VIVVPEAGPLIYLAGSGHLELLRELYADSECSFPERSATKCFGSWASSIVGMGGLTSGDEGH
jgi:hypothetical protein